MLIRHIAGVPIATEQRCVRCCEVILRSMEQDPAWPGSEVEEIGPGPLETIEDCKAVDLSTREPDGGLAVDFAATMAMHTELL